MQKISFAEYGMRTTNGKLNKRITTCFIEILKRIHKTLLQNTITERPCYCLSGITVSFGWLQDSETVRVPQTAAEFSVTAVAAHSYTAPPDPGVLPYTRAHRTDSALLQAAVGFCANRYTTKRVFYQTANTRGEGNRWPCRPTSRPRSHF